MPYQTLKKSKPEYDPEYVQQKISLIEKGLPVDISEAELQSLEDMLRGARSFYIDLISILHSKQKEGMNVDADYIEECKNLAGTELALRAVDDFRTKHWSHIKNEA